jgi:GTPase SAR1 family protein
MPLPVVPVLIGLGSIIVGGVVFSNWERIEAKISGKSFAVLGPRHVGKTTLIHFMRTGEVKETHRRTTEESFDVSTRAFMYEGEHKEESIEVKMKSGVDVSGDRSKLSQSRWKDVVESADVVLYLFQANRVLDDDEEYKKRLREEAGLISKWIEGRANEPSVQLVGTHCDLDEEFEVIKHENTTQYYLDGFSDDEAIRKMSRKLSSGTVILGSLETEEHARGLVTQIIKRLPE